MPSLLVRLQTDFPTLLFQPVSSFYWSPEEETVYYAEPTDTSEATWKLLHETCHGILNHQLYKTDFDLLQLEVAAWRKARELGKTYHITIGSDHIEDCLDSYRDWLHARSTCPSCLANGLQTTPTRYECLNCESSWQVSRSRFCRAYRRSMAAKKLEYPALSPDNGVFFA